MEYRVCRKTGDQISVLGMGTAYIGTVSDEEAAKTLERAKEGGINYFDLATNHASTFERFGKAFSSVRNQVMYQVHFGAEYTSGEYGWTTDGEVIKKQVSWMLDKLKTDYIDYGFIHCLDELDDWEEYKKNGALDYMLKLKDEGVIRHIGLSSHTPATAQVILNEAPVDMLMFSINPAYDYQQGKWAFGSVDERTALYQRCAADGIGISVMKPFAGGQVLDAATSPFGEALTPYQCFKFALDKPGVVTVLPGIATKAQVDQLLGYFDASEEEKDYSIIGSFKPSDAVGKCVYCNHCRPCPMGIDIGMVNKFYDLAKSGDAMAAEHYRQLEKNASDCVKCGHCNKRCPFGVDQMSRMEEISSYFK